MRLRILSLLWMMLLIPAGGGPYDPDPEHIWNRLFRALYVRVDRDGREHGHDELDPLLWHQSGHLLSGPSHQQAVSVLDEFLKENAQRLVTDPLKRAMLQRDLWAVFDWSASEAHRRLPGQRQLENRLAEAIRRLVLPAEQIRALPDNYDRAFQESLPSLPADLFRA